MTAYAPYLPEGLLPDPLPPRESTWLDHRGYRVHVERVGDPGAPDCVVLLHGAGGHAEMLWPFAAAIAAHGVYVLVPDLPEYGRTRAASPGRVRYSDWVDLAARVVKAQSDSHAGRLVIVGASMGGLLGYDVATRTGVVDGLVATCLLDPSDARARRAMARPSWLGPIAPALLKIIAGPLANLRVPIRWLAKMDAISDNPAIRAAVLADPLGGGNRIPLGFLRTFLTSRPAVPPERARVPVVLAHPADDRWTPVEVSMPFLDRLAGPTEVVMLPNAGHLPMEQPGAGRLIQAVVTMARGR